MLSALILQTKNKTSKNKQKEKQTKKKFQKAKKQKKVDRLGYLLHLSDALVSLAVNTVLGELIACVLVLALLYYALILQTKKKTIQKEKQTQKQSR